MNLFPSLALPVLLAFVAMSAVMLWINSRRLVPAESANLHGLRRNQLGLAVELACNQADFAQMVGQPGTAGDAPSTRVWLGRQQYLDFVFILLYAALFWILGGVERAAGFPGAAFLGSAARLAILLAALFDVLEDIAILRALGARPLTLPVRTFGLPKWGFFFLAALLVSVWFLDLCFYGAAWRGLDRALAGLTGLSLAAGGLVGLVGVLGGAGTRIGLATSCMSPAIVALVVLML